MAHLRFFENCVIYVTVVSVPRRDRTMSTTAKFRIQRMPPHNRRGLRLLQICHSLKKMGMCTENMLLRTLDSASLLHMCRSNTVLGRDLI